MKKSLVYLATPYFHPDPKTEQVRFEKVNKIAAALMAEGVHVYSPISHSHPIAEAGNLPGHWTYWEKYDTAVLECCKAMIVYQLDGWQASKGVRAELFIAKKLRMPVYYLSQEWGNRDDVSRWLNGKRLKPGSHPPAPPSKGEFSSSRSCARTDGDGGDDE